MRLLLDEHLDKLLAVQLRDRGHDVVAVTELADLVQGPDPMVLEHGVADDRVVVTYDVEDYVPLARMRMGAGESLPGVLLLSPRTFPQGRRSFGLLLEQLDAYLHAHPEATIAYGIEWL